MPTLAQQRLHVELESDSNYIEFVFTISKHET